LRKLRRKGIKRRGREGKRGEKEVMGWQ